MKPNDKKEIDGLQEELNQLKSDVSNGIGLHVAHAVDLIGTNLEDIGANLEDVGTNLENLGANMEDMEKSEERRRNLEDLLASESLSDPIYFVFLTAGKNLDSMPKPVSTVPTGLSVKTAPAVTSYSRS